MNKVCASSFVQLVINGVGGFAVPGKRSDLNLSVRMNGRVQTVTRLRLALFLVTLGIYCSRVSTS